MASDQPLPFDKLDQPLPQSLAVATKIPTQNYIEIPNENPNSFLLEFFDRIVLINLKRRRDRLTRIKREFTEKSWCFRNIEVFNAVDGNKLPNIPGFEQGNSAFGCLASHRQILQETILNHPKDNILVLEDDITVKQGWIEDIEEFLKNVPDNWDQLMLGGQLMTKAETIAPGVLKTTNCQRTHAYAIRGNFMRDLYARWASPNAKVHCDWIMGEIQKHYNVYAPDPFIFGQSMSQSDINGRVNPTKFWIPPIGKEPIFVIKCSKNTIDGLRTHKIHTGYQRNGESDIDIGLLAVFERDNIESTFKKWVDDLMWEVVSEEGMYLAVWYPGREKELEALIKKVWSGPCHYIVGEDVDKIMNTINNRAKLGSNIKMF